MFKSMHERIGMIAEEDTERADKGNEARSILTITLKSGVQIGPVSLIDGVNSHDEQTIDVAPPDKVGAGGDEVWVIHTSEIAALHQKYPD